MKRKFIYPALIGVGIVLASGFTVVQGVGIGFYTGSPIDGQSCGTAQAGCHHGGTATATATITASPAFGGSGTNLTYVAGQTYTLTVSSTSYTVFGFDVEVLNSNSTSSASNVGLLAVLSSNTKKQHGSPTNITHNTPIAVGSTGKFTWTAPPASGDSTAYFYAAINLDNGDGAVTGDANINLSYTLTQAAAGIETYENIDANLSVFPNPTTDNVRITYTLVKQGSVSIKLFNLNGELVADLLNETQQGVGLQKADVSLPSGIAKGLYMVKLSINGGQTIQKLLVR